MRAERPLRPSTFAPLETILSTERLRRAQELLREHDIEALLVGPSADLRYLVGYAALPLERLTLLVVPAEGDPSLLVPELEAPRAAASGASDLLDVRSWQEQQDPLDHVRDLIRTTRVDGDGTFAVQDQLWSRFLLGLQASFPRASWVPGSTITGPMRVTKTPDEIERLRAVAAAIDRVHAQVPELLRPGRTEAEVGADIRERILEDHDEVNFIIVASGPNGASPHHETGRRVLEEGDPVVVDIGGTREQYCSDSTRNYVLGPVPPAYRELHDVLLAAQRAGVAAAAAGTPAQDVDRACRQVIADAGYGEYFVHRTGHGIGVEAHEDPYLVEGNEQPLGDGMAFSVEPGIYVPDTYGARIEDIVVARPDGGERLNVLDRELVTIEL